MQAKNAVYRHATANDPLGERWEQDVDRMQPCTGVLDAPVLLFLLALLHPHCRMRPAAENVKLRCSSYLLVASWCVQESVLLRH